MSEKGGLYQRVILATTVVSVIVSEGEWNVHTPMTRLSCMYCWTLASSSKSGMGETLYMSVGTAVGRDERRKEKERDIYEI